MREGLPNIIWTFYWTSSHDYDILDLEGTWEIFPNRCLQVSLDVFCM